MHEPSWFGTDSVLISNARTCGINKDGALLYRFDKSAGALTSEVNDDLSEDVSAVLQGREYDSSTLQRVSMEEIRKSRVAVPAYYDRAAEDRFRRFIDERYPDFEVRKLGEMVEGQLVFRRRGHGSPSSHERTGGVPYIKVSDLRAGKININPTNLVPESVAQKFWKDAASGLEAFDVISPERASKNIGDFCILMPGQERIVLTREVIVLRPGACAEFDSFFLFWALTLRAVREQWGRFIFMQTNREDVGDRYLDLLLPVAPSRDRANQVSEPFRRYYETIAREQGRFLSYLEEASIHHLHLGKVGES